MEPKVSIAAVAAQLFVKDNQVVLDNGLLKVTLTTPEGHITRIRYNGLHNLLELNNPGFWDLNWSEAGTSGTRGSSDKFIMLRGSSGFYSYAIYEHTEDMDAFNLNETRIAFMLSIRKFRYMAMADDRQRKLPLPEDRLPPRGRELAFPEAVLLVDPVEPEFEGEVYTPYEKYQSFLWRRQSKTKNFICIHVFVSIFYDYQVDDKYQYSCENKDNRVHGFICNEPPVGFWQITPSNEFRTGGPLKQDLTSHVNPTTLAMFVSAHYGGEDLVIKFGKGEPWKKVFGPVFIYLNSVSDEKDPILLWDDAKEQMKKEVQNWPYSFPASADFPHADERGSIQGRLFAHDRYISNENIPAKGAYVGVALPGETGSFQTENKGYQFWANADDDGYFSIINICPGEYNIYAWISGLIGDYRYEKAIVITPGCAINLGDLVYIPPRDGPTLWEIGIPDRSAAEFFVPDPNPMYINKLYINHPEHRFRQYGLWERYADLYPDKDLVYTVGIDDYAKDWFYAQATRKVGENAYEGTTWQIKFKLDRVHQSGKYTLRIALASANMSILEVRINNPGANPPKFSSGLIGKDNAIARHGIHGLYWLFRVDIESSLLVQGLNTIYLTQAQNTSDLHGIMYDYIRLEGPPPIDLPKL